MYIVKAEVNQVEKIVDISIRAFETDVNVGGIKGDCPPGFDSIVWHQQMAREGHLLKSIYINSPFVKKLSKSVCYYMITAKENLGNRRKTKE